MPDESGPLARVTIFVAALLSAAIAPHHAHLVNIKMTAKECTCILGFASASHPVNLVAEVKILMWVICGCSGRWNWGTKGVRKKNKLVLKDGAHKK